MKLMYGEYKFSGEVLRLMGMPIMVLNFSGLKEGLCQLHLMPPTDIMVASNTDDQQFDIAYANWILGDPERFKEVMEIMQTIVENGIWGIYLVINNDRWTDAVIESFLKFMQARYGVTASYINSVEDIPFAADTDIDPRYGIVNYDQDYLRLTELLEVERINAGGTPYERE